MYVKRNTQAKAKVSTNTDTWSGQDIDTQACLGKRNLNFEKTAKGVLKETSDINRNLQCCIRTHYKRLKTKATNERPG